MRWASCMDSPGLRAASASMCETMSSRCSSMVVPPDVGRDGTTLKRRSRPVGGISASGGLRDLPDRLLVERHIASDAFARRALDDPHLLDDEGGVDEHAPVIVVQPHRAELLGRALELDVAAELAVRGEQYDVERFDASVLLHAAIEADGLVEHLEATLLTTGDGLAPRDEEHAVGHADSFRFRPGGWASVRVCPADSLRGWPSRPRAPARRPPTSAAAPARPRRGRGRRSPPRPPCRASPARP